MSVSYWLDQSSQESKNYDVLIVGAGVAGVSLSYWLHKQHPQLKIALIDREHIAAGASGRNAGFVTCGSTEHLMKLVDQYGYEKAARIWKFSEENHILVREEIIADNNDVLYKNTGSCTVAPSESRYHEYVRFVEEIKSHNIELSIIDPETIEKEFALKGFFGGAFYPKDGEIHPVKLIHKILSKAQVDFFPQQEVFKLTESTSGVHIRTRTASFSANKVVFTTNAYIANLFPELAKFVSPGRGQAMTTEPVDFTVRGPCYFTQSLCYFRQLADRRLLIGGFRNLNLEAENTPLDQITEPIQSELIKFVSEHFKSKKPIKVSHQWSGIMAFSFDGMPILGQHPTYNNVFLHTGCSGHGMGNNFHAAKAMAQHLDGKHLPEHLSISRIPSL
ncbi:MAG: FAD-binding oxidoreductase [Bdellovibrionaceae bacterium]|nr:FAD-binding oxidoreductase [Pseudobdellovibrionaceae bacterium]